MLIDNLIIKPRPGQVRDWKIGIISRAGLVGSVSVKSDWVGYHVYLHYGTLVCWYIKTPAWVWISYSRSDNHCRT